MSALTQEPVANTASKFIYGASIFSVLLSLATLRKNPTVSNFIGLWAPTIIGLGILMKENQLLEMNRRQLQASM